MFDRPVGVALIGTGFMGKSHALAYGAVRAIMGNVPAVRRVVLADVPGEKAAAFANQFGFERGTDDWQDAISDPSVDLVSITTPNGMHCDMALAALAAGKHVWCEKPMALTLTDAREMSAAATRAGRVTRLGYNYLANPAFAHAVRLLCSGAIGQLIHIRGWVDEDYQADGSLPWTWRSTVKQAGLGALGDLGCHLISLLHALAGPIDSVLGDISTAYADRPLAGGGMARVENEDIASALLTFASGLTGVMTASRSAWGRTSRLGFEAHGTQGMTIFDQERMNELQLFRNNGDRTTQGFTTILTGTEHPPYAAFCPAPGHQLGFNDLKVIELAGVLTQITTGQASGVDFAAGLEIERVIHAIAQSARTKTRVKRQEV